MRRVGLTQRELDVVRWAGEGATNAEIARQMDVSERTVKHYFEAVFTKLGACNRAHAVGICFCRGLIKCRAGVLK